MFIVVSKLFWDSIRDSETFRLTWVICRGAFAPNNSYKLGLSCAKLRRIYVEIEVIIHFAEILKPCSILLKNYVAFHFVNELGSSSNLPIKFRSSSNLPIKLRLYFICHASHLGPEHGTAQPYCKTNNETENIIYDIFIGNCRINRNPNTNKAKTEVLTVVQLMMTF